MYANYMILSFVVMFIVVIGIISFTIIKNYMHNKSCPKLTKKAKVIDKRIKTSKFLNQGGETPHYEENESCYILFQLGSGEKIELWVKRSVYLNLSKGDNGKLTFQGNKFIKFEK